jgi:hypothetical protein
VEHALEFVIACRLREPRNKTEENALFQEKGILGTFSEKIWAAYFLKIVGHNARRDLNLLREIRNQAAHDMNPCSFESTPAIRSRCGDLGLAEHAAATRVD